MSLYEQAKNEMRAEFEQKLQELRIELRSYIEQRLADKTGDRKANDHPQTQQLTVPTPQSPPASTTTPSNVSPPTSPIYQKKS